MAKAKVKIKTTTNSYELVQSLENVFKKAPSLPAKLKHLLVKSIPWIALVFGVFGLYSGLGVIRLALGLTPAVLGGIVTSSLLLLHGILLIISSLLLLLSFPGLRRRLKQGWNYLFWAQVFSIASSVCNLD